MKIYMVGGAVRDELLGLPVSDHDYVVVGATPEQMLARGFRPVGKDFPVFLHPATQEEYALARTERKTAPGYRGFVFHTAADVTLEQDLVRRDLTINAIAKAEDGALSDPFGGLDDLKHRVFRHVSDAFGEDPVRILRLARFAARFTDFTVAPATMALMRRMVAAGEVDALVPERVWQEVARGLMEARPSRMLDVLRDSGALARIMPQLDALWRVPEPWRHRPDAEAKADSNADDTNTSAGAHAMQVIDYAAARGLDLAVRFASLTLGLRRDLAPAATPPAPHGRKDADQDDGVALVEQLCKRLKVPNDCRDLAIMTVREHVAIGRAEGLDADAVVKLFERCDGFRKPQRFEQMLLAAECDFLGGGKDGAGADVDAGGNRAAPFAPAAYMLAALAAARGVDAGAIAQGLAERPQQIPLAVHEARVAAVQARLAAVTGDF